MSLSLMITPRYGKWSSNTWKITMSRRNLRQTGQSSIAILRGRLLALIILDLRLGQDDGLDLLRVRYRHGE